MFCTLSVTEKCYDLLLSFRLHFEEWAYFVIFLSLIVRYLLSIKAVFVVDDYII